jgi:hypothetical protein
LIAPLTSGEKIRFLRHSVIASRLSPHNVDNFLCADRFRRQSLHLHACRPFYSSPERSNPLNYHTIVSLPVGRRTSAAVGRHVYRTGS